MSQFDIMVLQLFNMGTKQDPFKPTGDYYLSNMATNRLTVIGSTVHNIDKGVYDNE